MPIEVNAPDGSVVRFPDGTSDTTIRQVMARNYGGPAARPQQSWGEYLRGLGREALQGATFDFADEAGLIDRDASKRFGEENPVMSTVARLAGGVAPFAIPATAPLRLGALARAARSAAEAPTMLGRVGRSAALGSGLGTVSGLGAGEGDLAERLPSAEMGGLFGLALGAAVPPVAAVAGRAAGAAAPMFERLTGAMRRPSEPPLPFSAFDAPPAPASLGVAAAGGAPGTRFVNDMAPGSIGNAQTRALGAIQDALQREGTPPAQIEAQLDEFATWASRFNTSSYGQDVVTPVDLSPGLQRLLGTLARQSPEAARDIVSFLQARQTGLTPQGADAVRLSQRGLPTRQRFAEPMTGEQAMEEFGPAFQRAPGGDLRTGLDNMQPMGHWARSMDFLKRSFGIKDSDFHGHAADPGRTVDQLAASMKEGARRYYGALYGLGRSVDLTPAVEPVLIKWAARAEAAQPPLSDALRAAVRLFYRRDGAVQGSIKDFDLYGKQYLDDHISKAFRAGDNAVGRELIKLRDELFAALENSTSQPIRNIGSVYRGARAQYSDDMRVQQIVERFRDKAFGGDPRSLLEFYGTLSREEQKLARLGVQWAVEKATGRTGERRQVLDLFRNPEADRLLRGIIRRSSGTGKAFSDRPERFGAAIDVEGLFPETRNVAVGGSMTARNVQDDLMQVALDASQHAQTLMGVLRGNQSLYQLVERGLILGWDRIFGVGADAAREAVRMLLTANPAERTAMLRQVAAMTPPDRMIRFNELMGQIQRQVATPGVVAGAGIAGAPTPQQPQQGGPVFL
jgi:hypothetical protein